ncbi:MAG TPA: aldo/keto reductase [Candidatus Dormibacteraeota bacterium]|nr:aldo/keto reductase [Candidatus Dormibacteraeota bacterium]
MSMSELPRRTLGESGIEVPIVGVGCNNFGGRTDEETSRRVILTALDLGVGFFDTADIYSRGRSEEILGRTLGDRRDQAVIATKFGGSMGSTERGGGSRRWITLAVEDSLRRLATDHIDLYQHHFFDPGTPLEETLGALDELVRSGKVRAIGCSNYDGAQIEEAHTIATAHGWARFVTAQNEYSLLKRREVEESVTPTCRRLGMGILPFFPLVSGLLSGKYHRGEPPPQGSRLGRDPHRAGDLMTDANFDLVEALASFARGRGVELIDVAIGALAAQPQVVSVIAGATSPEQIARNARAGAWEPSDSDLAEIDRISSGRALA